MSHTVAITGATGFIGRHVAAELVARGAAVTAIVRPGSPNRPPPSTTVATAPLEPAALRAAFSGADVVVHLAGVVAAVAEKTFADVNAEGTRAVAMAARDAGARLVHISSLAAAGPAPASKPHREGDESRPITPYGRSKLESERIIASIDGLRSLILRPGVVYGPTDRAVFPLFQAAQRGVLPLVGRRDAAYSFVHVDDVVRSIVAAVEKTDVDGVVFVGHPTPVTPVDVVNAIRAAVKRNAMVLPIPMPVTRALARACDLVGRMTRTPMLLNSWRCAELEAEGFVCDVSRLRDALGVTPAIDLFRGTASTAQWYRDAGWL